MIDNSIDSLKFNEYKLSTSTYIHLSEKCPNSCCQKKNLLNFESKRYWNIIKNNLKKIINLNKFNNYINSSNFNYDMVFSREGQLRKRVRNISPELYRPNTKQNLIKQKRDFYIIKGKSRIWKIFSN